MRSKIASKTAFLLVFLWQLTAVLPVFSDPCNSMVFDADGLLGGNIAKIEDSAKKLENAGADVRVLVINSFGDAGNLDNYVDGVQRGCKSWQATDGGRKNNLIVFAVAVKDRKTGLFYGGQWTRILDEHWTRILTDKVTPRFRDGDFAGGISTGLNEVTLVITEKVHAANNPKPTTVINTQPTDFSGLWKVLGWIVGVVAIGFLIICSARWYWDQKAENEKCRAAQQLARIKKSACTEKANGLDEMLALLGAKINKALLSLAGQTRETLTNDFSEMKKRAGKINSAYAGLMNSANNPEVDDLSVQEYANMERVLGRQLDDFESIYEEIRNLEERIGKIAQLANSLNTRVSEVEKQAEGAEKAIQGLAQAGFKTENASAVLAEAKDRINNARDFILIGDLELANTVCTQAETSVKELLNLPETLRKRVKDITASIESDTKLIVETTSLIDQARQVFTELSSEHPRSAWDVVSGNGSEAERLLAEASALIPQAEKAVSMEVQDWDGANKLLASVSIYINDSVSCLQSIFTLKQNLIAAKRAATSEFRAANEDIQKAEAFILEHDPDVSDSLVIELAKAREQLGVALEELSFEKPDYIKVVKLVKAVNSTADKILDKARSEFEAVERFRLKLVTTVREAKRSIDTVREYIRDHRSDVNSSAERYLSEAQHYYGQYETSTDPKEKLSYADKADKKADEALEDAQNDVRRVKRRREEEEEDSRRRHHQNTQAAVILGALSSKSSDDDGGGSSSGGGGSVGFSSSSGGGGSVGW